MVLTPNMNLIQPIIGTATGLEWEQATNANASTLDGHNHSPGSGVPVNQNSIALTGDFSFLSYSAIDLLSARFSAQGTPLAGAADLGCLYVSGVDLWFNDVNGNQIQMTSGGAVLATSSGITSGSATASFSGSVLIVNAASNTPANIRGASILLGNNVAASKYLTLSPPAAMAANYALVLPPLPGSTLFVTLDSSGNMATAASISASQLATGSIVGTQLANGTVTATQMEPLGQQVSSSCGSFSTTSGSATFATVTNLSVTITTRGKPVQLMLVPDGSTSTINASAILNTTSNAFIRFARGGTAVAIYPLTSNGAPTSLTMLNPVGAGTYTYTVDVNAPSGTTVVNHAVLIAFEVP